MDTISSSFKALADENRVKIIRALLADDICVRALANALGISEAAVSQHLKILKKAGLVIGEKRGYWTHYRVSKPRLEEIALAVKELTELPPPCRSCRKDVPHKNECCRKEGEGDV